MRSVRQFYCTGIALCAIAWLPPQALAQDEPIPGNWKRASELIGFQLESRYGEKLGRIEDFAIQIPDGKVGYAVVATGRIRKVHRLVPYETISFATAKRRTAALGISIERWNSAPVMKKADGITALQQEAVATYYLGTKPNGVASQRLGIGAFAMAGRLMGQSVSGESHASGKITDLWLDLSGREPARMVMRKGFLIRRAEIVSPLNAVSWR